MAYRKGRNAEDIATCIVLMFEEVNETGDLLAIIMEDEEKILDRVIPELQVATMANKWHASARLDRDKKARHVRKKMHPHKLSFSLHI